MNHELYPWLCWWQQRWAARSNSWHRSGRGPNWHSVLGKWATEAVLPSDMHHGIQCTKFSFFFLLDLLFFLELVSTSCFYLLCFPCTSHQLFLKLSKRTMKIPRNEANKSGNLSAPFLLNQWELASFLATENFDWWREW